MNSQMICPHGHGGAAIQSGRFCIECGSQLILFTAPDPAPAVPSAPAGWNPAVQPVAQSHAVYPPHACTVCGGGGARLDNATLVCRECDWLRPLVPGYHVDCSAFQWALDGSAMAKLRSVGALNAAARAISDHIGRRWIETAFNAVRLGPQQMPQIYDQAVLAGRILGMPTMPDVYISGEHMWDAMTFGSDKSSFVVIGTALINNFRGPDLLFLLAREMGHCRAGHALWKTVIRFLVGDQGPRKGLSGGVLKMLSPTQLLEGALELPLMAWARQAEITADRAGVLAVGDEAVARRVLLSWSLRSSNLYNQINVQSWMAQEVEGTDDMTKLSEMISSPTPYITRRLRLLSDYARSPELKNWRAILQPLIPSPAKATPPQQGEHLRVSCPTCRASMRVPFNVLSGKTSLNVRCPNTKCGKILVLKPKTTPAAAGVQPR